MEDLCTVNLLEAPIPKRGQMCDRGSKRTKGQISAEASIIFIICIGVIWLNVYKPTNFSKDHSPFTIVVACWLAIWTRCDMGIFQGPTLAFSSK